MYHICIVVLRIISRPNTSRFFPPCRDFFYQLEPFIRYLDFNIELKKLDNVVQFGINQTCYNLFKIFMDKRIKSVKKYNQDVLCRINSATMQFKKYYFCDFTVPLPVSWPLSRQEYKIEL